MHQVFLLSPDGGRSGCVCPVLGASSDVREWRRIGRCHKINWAALNRDGGSHRANANNRAFGDNWRGVPLGLVKCGSGFLTEADGKVGPANSKEIKRESDIRGFPLQNLLPRDLARKVAII